VTLIARRQNSLSQISTFKH